MAHEFRLSTHLVPLHYELSIITYLELPKEKSFSFEGKVLIKVECIKSTNIIRLHALELDITENPSIVCEGNFLTVKNTSFDIENDFYTIETVESLEPTKEYHIHVCFKSSLKDDLVGYYHSTYLDKSSSTTKHLAVTHFEPSEARRAFPCFDEPALKATFGIRLGHHKNLKAVSNMPLDSSSPLKEVPDFVWSYFKSTVTMCTYLIAFMISDFECVASEKQSEATSVRVWAREAALYQSQFPSVVGPKFLSFYEDFFGLKFPLPKLDLLAVPDFKISGMENWGLIIFRESWLLLDEKTTSTTSRLSIASVLAHELAHMWFGNLVSLQWWDDLWLKEGFATYMAGVAVDHVFPEWNSLDAEALSRAMRVFHLDSLASSHPVSVPIGHSKEIAQIFDGISYDKGSFILRMMSLFLGEEVFRHGVNGYLVKHQFSNAKQDDLWESMTEQAHRYSVLPADLTVKQIMDTWTLQTGYPVLSVIRDYEKQKVTVSQKRFLAMPPTDEADSKGSWWVPLSYSTQKAPQFNTQPQYWLPKDKESIELDIKAGNEWIVFNNRAAGLYKVNYDMHNWCLLIGALNSPQFEEIDVLNRALLIVDAMDLAYGGFLDYKVAMPLISYVVRETAFIPWFAALSKLGRIKNKLSRTGIYEDFKNFVRPLFESVLDTLGSLEKVPESFERGRLLSLISGWACHVEAGDFSRQARDLFEKWRSSPNPNADNNPVPKDVRRAVYGHAAENGCERVWNFLWEQSKLTNVGAEINNILLTLTNTRREWILKRYLEWTLTDKIRKQDAFLIFRTAASEPYGYNVAKQFFYDNIQQISQYFGANSNLIGQYFSAVAEQMITPTELDELTAFSEKHATLLAPASLSVKQGLETVKLNILWYENHYDNLAEILKLQYASAPELVE